MIKKISAALLLFVLATSCGKEKPLNPEPKPSAELLRTITFTHPNNEAKVQSYTTANRLEPEALASEGKLKLFMSAMPKTDNTTGESILLELDAPVMSSNVVGQYGFTANATQKITNARYVYHVRNNSGDIRGSIIEKSMGVAFGGTVSVTRFDTRHHTVSGTYYIEVRGLISDPTESSTASPIDPANKCNLVVEGKFENIRVQ